MSVLVLVSKHGLWHWPGCVRISRAKLTERRFANADTARFHFRFERAEACLDCTLRRHFYSLTRDDVLDDAETNPAKWGE